ncbi:O-antigen flippase Wzx [Bacillus sp. JCM 19047]|nr:O-antigen flippase Wzx [Bacillus sp. JCM 19047]
MLSRLRNNKLINDVFQLASGTAGAQIIALSTVPLITRLYGPEAYGILGVFVAISGILIPIAALTLPVAIVLPKTNKEAKNIFMTSIYLSTIIAGLMLLTILLLNKQIVDLLNIEEIKQYLYLYPIIILAASFTQVTQNFLYRNGEFKEVARATFLSSLITNLSKVLLGFKWQSAGLLIVITSSAVLIQGIIQFRRSLKSLKLSLIELDVSYKVFKKYKNFPFYKAPETFINAISHSMPVVLLSIFF